MTDTLQQAELTSKQKAKLDQDAGWAPRISPRHLDSTSPASWRADWWEKRTDGKRGYHHRQKQFPTRPELVAWIQAEQRKRAKERKMTTQSERRGDSVVTLSHLTPVERAAIAQAVETIRKAGGRVEALADAAKAYARIQLTGAKKTVAEIIEEHLALLQKTARPATLRDRRHNLKSFAARHGGELAGAITPTMIDEWTMERPNPPTQAARWRAVRALFNFALRRGYMDEPPTKRATPVASQIPDEIAVFSPAEVEELMRRATQTDPRLVPYLAIGIFAGLRPENELGRLDWSKINLKSRKITVEGKNAKTKKKRLVPISENLAAWLETVPENQRRGQVYYYRRALRRVLGQEQVVREARRTRLEARAEKEKRKLSGPKPGNKPKVAILRWGQDIMRHTFGSYRQAVIQNINQLCEEMGNTPHVARAHYLNPPDENEAKKFWNITPASEEATEKKGKYPCNENIERRKEWLFIGGEDTSFPVVEKGENLIGIPDRRFEWETWDGALDAETCETAERLSGQDIAGIAQLTADAAGRVVLDKGNRPDGKSFCIAWSADGRARILQTLKVTEYDAYDVQKRQACLSQQDSEGQAVATSEREKTTAGQRVNFEHIMAELGEIIAQGAETHADIQFLLAERKAAKKRRQTIARENHTPRGKAGDEIDWDEYEVCRAIDNQLVKARKEKRRLTQIQAAQRVIDNYNAENNRIKCSAESLAKYYRRWKRRRRMNRTD